jgi:uroporphyrinogen-III synthase
LREKTATGSTQDRDKHPDLMPSLQNKRILITRTRNQASELAAQLAVLGAIPILIPTIEIIPPDSFDALDSALSQLSTFDWLIFTSANAVDIFKERNHANHDPQTSIAPRIAVIGPATAKAVQGIGLHVDLIPRRYIAESLAESLTPQAAGKRILLIRAAEARDVLPEALTEAGANLTIAEAYQNRIPSESIPALQQLFSSPANHLDAITFTSASTARNLVALLEAASLTLPPNIALASIGPITSQAMRDLGLNPTTEATEPTISALVSALTALLTEKN